MAANPVSGQVADGASVSAGLTSLATGTGGSNFPGNVTAGNIVVVRVGAGPSSTHSAPTDSLGATWTQIGTTTADATISTSRWWAVVPSTGAMVVTGNFSSSTGATIIAVEVTGQRSFNPIVDGLAAAAQTPSAGADTVTVGTVALPLPATSGMMLAFNFNASGTVGNAGSTFNDLGAFCNVVGANRMRVEWKAVSTNAAQTATFQQAVGTDVNYAAVVLIADPSPPIISADPTEQTAADGGTATFSATAVGATSYQWERQGPAGGAYSNVTGGSGGTTTAYTTPALARSSDAGALYRIKATNAQGTTTSNPALLRVTLAPTTSDTDGLVVGDSKVGEGKVGAPKAAGTGPQTVTCTGIASAEAFGTAKINRKIVATGIASSEAFGTAKVGFRILTTGIPTAEAFGTAKLNLRITVNGIASAEAFGTSSVSLSGGPQTVTATGIASAEAFGAAKVNLKIAASSIASLEALGTPKLNLKIAAAGIASGEAFGATKLNLQVRAIGIPSSESFGATSVGLRITVAGIPTAEAFGLAKLNLRLLLSGIPGAEAFGTATVALANAPQTIVVVGIPSAEAFGAAHVQTNQTVHAVGIPSAEAFGSADIRNGNAAAYYGSGKHQHDEDLHRRVQDKWDWLEQFKKLKEEQPTPPEKRHEPRPAPVQLDLLPEQPITLPRPMRAKPAAHELTGEEEAIAILLALDEL